MSTETKRNLLMLHGALASRTQFDAITPLIQKEFNPQSINFSGHGGTFINPLGYTFPVFADDILKHLDAEKVEKADLFGFSMGGYAALYFAKLHPDRVNRIFTLNVRFKWDATGTQKEIAMLNAENMLLKVPSFANNLMLLHGMDMWKNVLKSTSDMMNDLTRQHFLTDDDFSKMNFPVLLAVGDRDLTSGIDQTVEVFRKVSDGRLAVLPNTAHPFEKVDFHLLAQMMNSFFK